MKKIITALFGVVLLLIVGSILMPSTNTVGAVGNGSGTDCDNASFTGVNPNDNGSQTPFVFNFDSGAGNVVTGVCIKSGSNMFGGNQHSTLLGNGVYETGCYTVSGVGGQIVTVTRNLTGSSCQDISHLDIGTSVSLTPTPTTVIPTPTSTVPTLTPTPTVTTAPTPTPGGGTGGPGDGLSDGRSDGRSDGGSSGGGEVLGTTSQGQVLGLSTTSSGSGSNIYIFYAQLLGALLLSLKAHKLFNNA